MNREEWAVRTINERGLRRVMEIGVRGGAFARVLLERTGALVWGVDHHPLAADWKLARDFPGRHFMFDVVSPRCAAAWPDGYFDFIHVDADHRYEAVRADLEAWWPKVASGGIFSGDDYATVVHDVEGVYGVVEAVNEFVDARGLTLHVVGVESDRREEQLLFARHNGERATRYLRRQPHEPFVNPCWWVEKP